MLGKVLKYDLKDSFKSLIPFYVVLMGLGVVARILGLFDEHSIMHTFYLLMNVTLIFLAGVSVLVSGMVSVKHYLENLFKDQGYLTHTLPVKKGTLLLSKVLSSAIILIMTVIVTSISLLIAFYYSGFFGDVFAFLGTTFAGTEAYKFLIFLCIYALVFYLATVLMIYAAIAIGHSRSNNKVFTSVGIGILFYFLMEFIYLAIVLITVAIEPTFIVNLDNGTFMLADLMSFLSIFMVVALIIGGIYYFISYKFMDKKLNLE